MDQIQNLASTWRWPLLGLWFIAYALIGLMSIGIPAWPMLIWALIVGVFILIARGKSQ